MTTQVNTFTTRGRPRTIGFALSATGAPAAAAPLADREVTAGRLTSTRLLILATIPSLALLEGGTVLSKGVPSLRALVFCAPLLGDTGRQGQSAKAARADAIADHFGSRLWAVLLSLAWSGVTAAVCFKIVDLVVGLRACEDWECEGLGTAARGERTDH